MRKSVVSACLLLLAGSAWSEPRSVTVLLRSSPSQAEVVWGRHLPGTHPPADFLTGAPHVLVEGPQGPLFAAGVSEYPLLLRKPGFAERAIVLPARALDGPQPVEIDLGTLEPQTTAAWLEVHPAVWPVVGLLTLSLVVLLVQAERTRRGRRFLARLHERCQPLAGEERIGQRVGRYWLLGRLGQGGMARVYRANSGPTLDPAQDLAVKLLLGPVDAASRSRYYQEARVSARMRHPNLVLFYEPLEVDDTVGLVMELVEGESLRARMSRGKVANPLAVLVQAASGLDYLHEQGIVHRDVKPENLMVTPDGLVKLMDFGIATAAGADARLTQTGALTGTLAYMAPEQIQHQPLTPAADQYALGALAYELLTGRPVFTEREPQALLLLHLYSDPVPPSYVEESLPAEVDPVLLRMLAKRPEERFASVSQAVAALAAAYNSRR